MKWLRYIPIAAFSVAILGVSAVSYAADTRPIVRMNGDRLELTATVTNASVDFGFTADRVEVCLSKAELTAGDTTFYRMGHTVTNSAGAAAADNSRMTLVATSDAIFENGAANVLAGAAAPLTGAGDGTDLHCRAENIQTRGIVIGVGSNGSTLSTVDVVGYKFTQ